MADQGFFGGGVADSATELTRGFSEAVQFYLRWHSVEGHTPATVVSYRQRLTAFGEFLKSRDRPLELASVRSLDVLAFLEDIKGRGNSAHTVRSRLLALKAFFNWAVQWELIENNPADRVKLPRVPKVRKPFLSPESFQQLLAICPDRTFLGARRAAMILLFATTGARLKEIADLDQGDLNWDAQLVRIVMGKGQKERSVPFHKKAQMAMLTYLRFRTDRHRSLWVTEEQRHASDPRPLSYWGVSTDMKRIFERAGLGDLDPCHAFRRTWAAQAVRQGIPRQYTQVMAGWSTPAMLDHYTAAMLEEEAAAEAFRDFDPFGS